MAEEWHYLAYMVRLWAVHHDGDLLWRASAENVHMGKWHTIADLAGLWGSCRRRWSYEWVRVTSAAGTKLGQWRKRLVEDELLVERSHDDED